MIDQESRDRSGSAESDALGRQVEDALAHLYDPLFLETGPLGRLVIGTSRGESRGHRLQRALVDAIQQLRPAAEVPYASTAWRKYRYLHLRYVEGTPVPAVARNLGVTPRHLRRSHQEAIAAVASVLRDRFDQVARPDRDATPRPVGDGVAVALIDEEAARLGAAPPGVMTDLWAVVDGVLETAAPLAADAVVIEAAARRDLPPVSFDRTVLRQVLLNLVLLGVERARRVAIDADVADGEIEVRVRCGLGEVGAGDAAAAVRGAWRFEVGRALVATQGARLDVEERRGAIDLILRLSIAEPLAVLVVDDNQDVVALMERYLAGELYRVQSATTGADGLRLAREAGPDLIVLDVMMPGQDGWEVLQTLKGDPRTRDIPVLVCSVLPERDLSLALGALDYLAKPVTREALLRAVARVRPRSGSSAPRPPRPGSA